MRFTLGSSFALKSVAIAVVFLITVVFLIALVFLIAGLGTAFAEVEDFRQPAGDLAQDPGLFHDGDAFGIKGSPWSGNFTSLSVGGKVVPSLGDADLGAPPAWQGELTADYSSSTLDGGLFPATVTDSGSVDALIMNDPVIFGDSDHGSGFGGGFDFFVSASWSSWSLTPSNFDPSPDRPRTPGSHCSSNGSTGAVIQCETEDDQGSFMTTSSGAGSDAAGQSGLWSSPNFPASAPFGGAYLSEPGLEMIAVQNNFIITSAGGATQGTLPPTCDACDAWPPVVGALAPPDFVSPNGSSPNSDPTAPLFGTMLSDSIGTQPATSVPEILPTAMLLIGFAGLALVGRRRLWRVAPLARPRHGRGQRSGPSTWPRAAGGGPHSPWFTDRAGDRGRPNCVRLARTSRNLAAESRTDSNSVCYQPISICSCINHSQLH